MTLPRLYGSALKRAICASPTPSKKSPTAQSATPTPSSQPRSASRADAPCTGSETIHTSTRLQQEDVDQRDDPEAVAPLLAPSPVARVLARWRSLRRADVARQPQAPDGHEDREQRAAGRRPRHR